MSNRHNLPLSKLNISISAGQLSARVPYLRLTSHALAFASRGVSSSNNQLTFPLVARNAKRLHNTVN